MQLATTLTYYKQPTIQAHIIESAAHKEIGVRFNDTFGRRPEVLRYPADILEMAKRRASSFHCSEELWHNPLHLKPGLRKQELDILRMGWDFILDIDCPDWELAKYLTHALINALRHHQIRAITVKFSGNKGFHIAVPCEALPKEFLGQPIAHLFPDAPKAMAHYLLNYIAHHDLTLEQHVVHFRNGPTRTTKQLASALGKSFDELIERRCDSCGAKVTHGGTATVFICPSCGSNIPSDAEFLQCPKDGTVMTPNIGAPCHCGGTRSTAQLNYLAIVEVDTLLLSVRHLYRMPYSLHEKSRLVSVPLLPEHVLNFDRAAAEPAYVLSHPPAAPFLDRAAAIPGEAAGLIAVAFHAAQPQEDAGAAVTPKAYTPPDEALPPSSFPPCIRKITAGLKDGRKRGLFILVNFLRSAGWDAQAIRAYVGTWNQANPEPLREVHTESHLRHHLMQAKPVLPPNCRGSYEEIQVCMPDNLCARIKNPLQYARRKAGSPAKEPSPKGPMPRVNAASRTSTFKKKGTEKNA